MAELSSLQRFLWLNNGSNFVNVGSAYKERAPHVGVGLGLQKVRGRLVGQLLSARTI